MAGTPPTSGDVAATKEGTRTLKFLYSYGGKILPRHPDGKLRYMGGETRVLSVDRSICFFELAGKLAELCGEPNSVIVKCQLPTDDLDALISVTSDGDLHVLIEEYDLFNRVGSFPLKIRCFLWSRPGVKMTAPPPPPASPKATHARKPHEHVSKLFIPVSTVAGCLHRVVVPGRKYDHLGNCYGCFHEHRPIIVVSGSDGCLHKEMKNPALRYHIREISSRNLHSIRNSACCR